MTQKLTTFPLMAKAKKLDLETSLQSLESLVERMENGGLSLEESLKEFEQGIKLIQSCQKSLSDAEQKVEILLSKSASAKPVDFD
jgi:exodeoxyribonuclease VII small subunit